MRDFTDRLDERLQQLVLTGPTASMGRPHLRRPAATPAAPAAGHEAPPPRRRKRLEFVAGGLGVLAIAGGSTLALTGSSVAGLPVLHTPTTDARQLTESLALGKPIDFSHAHVVRSAGGTAAVTTTNRGAGMCVAIPDPSAPGSAMGGCKATAIVEQHGFLVQSVPVQRDASAAAPVGAIAYVLPIGASNPRLFDGIDDLRPSVESGIVLAYTHGAARLRYEVQGRTATVRIAGPFVGEEGQCPDGHRYTPAPGNGTTRGGAPGSFDPAKYCAGHDRVGSPARG